MLFGISDVVVQTTVTSRVFVALSGGVDSSVAASLLMERGFVVHGVFIKTWQISGVPCNAAEDRRDAMRVAAKLGIPFHAFDLSDEYKGSVVDYMVREYAAGRTPNPDVMCNKEIKFGAFFHRAREMGAEYVATGHYARLGREFQISKDQFPNKFQNPKPKTKNETVTLLRAKDHNKDQTYFLWMLGQEALSRTLFPIGDYLKSEVREMARERGLITADKRDSQGICFLGKIDVRAFLAERLGVEEGSVLHARSGALIGSHAGAALYTLGQRHGFRVESETPRSEPLYVVSRDVARNTITVAPRVAAFAAPCAQSEIDVGSCNWIGEPPEPGGAYLGRIRHRGEFMRCRVEPLESDDASRMRVTFEAPLLAASGQSLVLYEGERVVGGGVIE